MATWLDEIFEALVSLKPKLLRGPFLNLIEKILKVGTDSQDKKAKSPPSKKSKTMQTARKSFDSVQTQAIQVTSKATDDQYEKTIRPPAKKSKTMQTAIKPIDKTQMEFDQQESDLLRSIGVSGEVGYGLDDIEGLKDLLGNQYPPAPRIHSLFSNSNPNLGPRLIVQSNAFQMVQLDQIKVDKIVGIGVILGFTDLDGYMTISGIIANSGAQKSGIEVKDKIISIDRKSVKDMNILEVSTLLRGMENSFVQLEIRKHGQKKPILKEVKRSSFNCHLDKFNRPIIILSEDEMNNYLESSKRYKRS